MTIYTKDAGASGVYTGESVLAAGVPTYTMRFNVFRTPCAVCMGAVIAPMVGGNRASFLPETIDDSVALAANIDQGSLGRLLNIDGDGSRGFDVLLVMVATARGSAQNFPNVACRVRFCGTLAKTNVAALTITSNTVTGGTLSISTIIAGSASSDEVQSINVASGAPSAGTFRLTFNGVESTGAAIPFNPTYAQVKAALNTIPALTLNVACYDGLNQTGNEVDSDREFSDSWIEAPLYGDSFDGNGMSIPKGAPLTGYTQSNGVTPETIHPAEDSRRVDSLKSFTMFCQHFRRVFEPLYATVSGWGGSWAGTALDHVAKMDNLAPYYFPNATAAQQDAVNTRGLFDFLWTYTTQPSMRQWSDSIYGLSGIPLKISNGGHPHLNQQSLTLGVGMRELLPLMSCVEFGAAPPFGGATAELYAENRLLYEHVVSSSWDDTIVGLYVASNPATTIVNQHHGWMTTTKVKAFGSRIRHITNNDISVVAPLNEAALNSAGLHPIEVLGGAAAVLQDKIDWLDLIYPLVTEATPPASDDPSQTLDVAGFAPYPLYAQVIANVGPLVRVWVQNETDVNVIGSFDGEHDHFWVKAGTAREFIRQPRPADKQCRPIKSGTVFLRGETADPTSGYATVSVVRT